MKKPHLIKALSLLLAAATLLPACSSKEPEPMRFTKLNSSTSDAMTEGESTDHFLPTSDNEADQTNVPAIVDPTDQPPDIIDIDPSIFEEAKRSAQYVLLYDITDDQTLYLVGGDEERIYPASITKLLTVLYALSVVPDTDEVFTVGEEVYWIASDSSKAYIQRYDQYTMKDLIYCMLLPSGNDAAYSMAANVGLRLAGDESVSRKEAFNLFIEGMNRYGQEVLGLTGTHFDSPDGYHSDEHYTTMEDLMKIALAAYRNPVISEIASTVKYTAVTVDGSRSLNLTNTNQMLRENSKYYYPAVNGMKTGYTSKAGGCVAITAEKDGLELLVLVMKSTDNNVRFDDAITFLELGFAALEEAKESDGSEALGEAA